MRGDPLVIQHLQAQLKNELTAVNQYFLMIVCVCRRVSDREIARHAHAGMDFDDIRFELGVATQCGQCEGCARDVIAQCNARNPVARLQRATEGSAISRV